MKRKNKKQKRPENFKIILVGPPNVGKTTIKKAFFDYFNPINLLKHPLEPTTGVNLELYSLFNSKIGLFDLAGQELDSWLNERSDIFIDSDVLIAVFDVFTDLNFIDTFLDKLIEIRKKTCNHSKLFILMHKIDLISKFDEIKRIKQLKNLLIQKPIEKDVVAIFSTSITKEFFISSYKKFEYIIRTLIQEDIIEISPDTYFKLQTFFRIIFIFDREVKYSIDNLKNKLNINEQQFKELINFLVYLELVEIDGDFFQISERGDFFYKYIDNLPSKQDYYKKIEQKIIENKKKILEKEKVFNILEEMKNIESEKHSAANHKVKVKTNRPLKKKVKISSEAAQVEESLLSLMNFIEELRNKEKNA